MKPQMFPPLELLQEAFDLPANKSSFAELRRQATASNNIATQWVEVFSTPHENAGEQSANRRGGDIASVDVTANITPRFNATPRYFPVVPKSYPAIGRPTVSFKALQRWEGVVLEVRPQSFVARLVDSEDENLIEEAEIDLEEITPEDLELVTEGAVFYWKIEYQDRPSGRQRASDFRFRRLPAWTLEQIDSARQEAARIREIIGWK